jgi:hypothetical protein
MGIALGAVFAGGAEFLDDRLHTEKAVKDLLPVEVISEIPSFMTPREEKAGQKKLWLVWAMTGLIFVTILGGFAISYLRG